jgi:folate-dependent phosphoribosylglycinamide formyltransferase PurN
VKVALVSRYPRVDALKWKQELGERLLSRRIELGVIFSRSGLDDQALAGLRQFGLDALRRYLHRGPGLAAAAETSATLDLWASNHGLPLHRGRRLGDRMTLEWARAFGPDLLVLVGADVVPSSLLEIPRLGTINPHYGLLPQYRGMNVTEWSIYFDDPVGVTIHLVDAGIDTGDILAQETIPVRGGATLQSIRAQQRSVSTRLLESCVVARLSAASSPVPQRPQDGRQFYRMHPLLLGRVERRLADGSYRWLGVEEPTPVDPGAPASTSDAAERPSAT